MVNVIIYWKSLFLVTYPALLLPIILCNDTTETRCLYVVVLMIGYWVLTAIPPAVVALLPLIFYPLLTIEVSGEITKCYLSSANMLFLSGVIVALAIERSDLHRRLFFYYFKLVGFSFPKFQMVVFTYTTFLSMWMPNVLCTRMMVPIVQSILNDLESHEVFLAIDSELELMKKPTKLTRCLYLSTAYGAAIGGVGTLIGTPSNLALLGIHTVIDSEHDDITFNHWSQINVLLMFLVMCIACLWLQIVYLGLFRPSSMDALAVTLDPETQHMMKDIISANFNHMGPVTFYEIMVGMLFLFVVELSFFRYPYNFPGWPKVITEHQVDDSCMAMLVAILLFVLPSSLDFLHAFSRDENKRPTEPMPALMVWRYVHQNMLWEEMFILGGGFVITKGIVKSGLNKMLVNSMASIASVPKYGLMVILCLIATVLTQFLKNVIVFSSMLPFLPPLAQEVECHAIYFMMPVCVAASFAFCLPGASASMEEVTSVCYFRKRELLGVGIVVTLVAYGLLVGLFPVFTMYS